MLIILIAILITYKLFDQNKNNELFTENINVGDLCLENDFPLKCNKCKPFQNYIKNLPEKHSKKIRDYFESGIASKLEDDFIKINCNQFLNNEKYALKKECKDRNIALRFCRTTRNYEECMDKYEDQFCNNIIESAKKYCNNSCSEKSKKIIENCLENKCIQSYGDTHYKYFKDGFTESEIELMKATGKYFPGCEECWELMHHIKSYSPNRECDSDKDCEGLYCNILGYCDEKPY